jgi:peptide/nickel transport system ATP-binding protein
MDRALLQLRDLSVEFPSARGVVRALRDVTLDIGRSEVFGLVGESGSGKSTLLTAIMGLSGPGAKISGSILFDGRDLSTLSPRQHAALRGARISMVFQNPMTTLSPVVRIDRQMLDIQHRESFSRSEKLMRAATMLAKVGIPDPEARLQSYPHQMSGGMLQRISIGMALLSRPDLLIADEPTTALDATLEIQILQLLRDLREEIGCSILYVSHHLGTVAQLCGRVAVMYAGSVVEQGSVKDVLGAPRHPYTRRLLECDPSRVHQPLGVLPTIPGLVPDLSKRWPGCSFEPRCDVALDICKRQAPRLAGEHGHLAACHLAAEAVR